MQLTKETREKLIQVQENIIGSLYNEDYSILEFKYFETTHSVKITFEKTERYRTIARYIQRDYQRYPVYSDWKYKHSKISKSLKINNVALEELRNNSDYLISHFAFEIIIRLNREDFVPSWAWRKIYDFEESKKIVPLKNKILETQKKYYQIIEDLNSKVSLNDTNIAVLAKKLSKIENKIEKNAFKLEQLKTKLFVWILKTKGNRLTKKLNKIKTPHDELVSENKKLNLQITQNKEEQDKQILNFKSKIEEIQQQYEEIKKTIVKLPSNITNFNGDNSFLPLSQVALFKYEKINGVYVIKNNEKEKYYVGQSKDILKRIKQHFNGTTPKNMKFAEDYFSSENKDTLFSVKIIPLRTKDELDATEKSLIEEYDSFANGYNENGGNN